MGKPACGRSDGDAARGGTSAVARSVELCAPDGEPVAQLRERVLSAWTQLVQEHAGQHVLLVSHGGVMRVLVQHLLGLSPEGMSRIAIPYAGFMRFSLP